MMIDLFIFWREFEVSHVIEGNKGEWSDILKANMGMDQDAGCKGSVQDRIQRSSDKRRQGERNQSG